MFQSKNI